MKTLNSVYSVLFASNSFQFKKPVKKSSPVKKLMLSIAIVLAGLYFVNAHGSTSSTSHPSPSSTSPITVGILVPMDHAALREIVEGFKTTLEKETHRSFVFKVQNAQGDINLERSILQQFVRQKVDLVVPIGTRATQMTVSIVKDIPIVSLAANPSEGAKFQKEKVSITGVIDEIGPEKGIDYLKALYPNLKKITLIYSNSEKVFPEVKDAEDHAKKKGIQIQKLMIQALPDLYTVSRHIEDDSEAIFILKDHLIVSGIQTLAKEAHKRKLPLMTSDEGSVKDGGSFALGVKERSIGEEGALLSAKVLSGEDPQKLPIQKLRKLVVFCNKDVLVEGLKLEALESLAKKSGYEFLVMEKK